MYKFVISIGLKPGALEQILQRAPEVQRLTRAESGCLAYEFFTCTDDPDRLVFIECFESKEAHARHCEQGYTKQFIAFHEQFHTAFKFERICTEDGQHPFEAASN
jgi:quinol monooxygenase YgiN